MVAVIHNSFCNAFISIVNQKTEKEEKQLKVYLVALGVSAVVLCLGIAIAFVWFKRRAGGMVYRLYPFCFILT